MTATEHILRVKVREPLSRAVQLRWQINPHALRAAAPAPIAGLNGQAERIARAMLEWRIDDDHAVAHLLLELGDEDLALPLADIHGRWLADHQREHAEFGALLRLTRINGRTAWARTDVLDRILGLRGGVYEGPIEP